MMAVYHDGIKEEFYFPDNPVTESEDGQSLLERTNGYLRNSSFHDVHFFNGEMDFRGFWKVLEWRDWHRIDYFGARKYFDYTVQGEVIIEDTFNSMPAQDQTDLASSFSLNALNKTLSNFRVVTFGNIWNDPSINLELVISDLNYLNTTDGFYYKKASLQLTTFNIDKPVICDQISTGFDLSFRNDLPDDSKKLRFIFRSNKTQFVNEGEVLVIVMLWDGSDYQEKLSCKVNISRESESNGIRYFDVSTGNVRRDMSPDILVPGIFKIRSIAMHFFQGQILLKNNASRNLSLIQTASTLSSLRPPGC
jgi:hypothetical protein